MDLKERTNTKNNMDPLFERRLLSKTVHVQSKFLQRNIQASILAQLKLNYEGRCSSEGYIQRNSITITNYSLGRANYIRGGADYTVEFQGDVCMPHPGQRFRAPVKLRSKVGIHAETPPIQVLLPRDLHIGNAEFEAIKVDEDIEFEVIGSQFKQQDQEIIVVGKLLTKVAAPVEEPLLSVAPPVEGGMETFGSPQSGEGDKKQIVYNEPEKPKKRKLKPAGGGMSNELTI